MFWWIIVITCVNNFLILYWYHVVVVVFIVDIINEYDPSATELKEIFESTCQWQKLKAVS